jgi:hypothetical protein
VFQFNSLLHNKEIKKESHKEDQSEVMAKDLKNQKQLKELIKLSAPLAAKA